MNGRTNDLTDQRTPTVSKETRSRQGEGKAARQDLQVPLLPARRNGVVQDGQTEQDRPTGLQGLSPELPSFNHA